MDIERIVITIIEKNKKLLLLKEKFNKSYERSKGKWSFPGGKVEANENILLAGLRELKEEIGIKNFFDFNIEGLFFIKNRLRKGEYILGISLLSRSFLTKKRKISNQTNFRWLDLEKIKKLKLRRHIRMVIKNYEKQRI